MHLGIATGLSRRELRGFVPSILFSGGEKGVWYDPSDLSTLFQDAAGTTPVTTVGQPVGLMLDKSKGLVLGSELVTNGTFNTNINGWAAILGDTAPQWEAGKLKTTATVGFGRTEQVVSVQVGKTYLLNITTQAGTGNPFAIAGSNTNLADYFSSTGSIGTLGKIFTATTSALHITVRCSGLNDGSTAYFDNISVREISSNYAAQSTATSRPILGQDATGRYYLIFDGVDDWLSTAAIDFTATDKMTVCAGVRKLSDAAAGMVAELSASISSNAGSWYLSAPDNAGQTNLGFKSRGSVTSPLGTVSIAAGNNAVVSVRSDIAGDSLTGKLNGGTTVSFSGDQGTGNYGNYPLYIGRRGGVSLPFNGRLYGLIVRGAASSDAQIVASETYMNSKTGAY